jgi:hypothetical protein
MPSSLRTAAVAQPKATRPTRPGIWLNLRPNDYDARRKHLGRISFDTSHHPAIGQAILTAF